MKLSKEYENINIVQITKNKELEKSKKNSNKVYVTLSDNEIQEELLKRTEYPKEVFVALNILSEKVTKDKEKIEISLLYLADPNKPIPYLLSNIIPEEIETHTIMCGKEADKKELIGKVLIKCKESYKNKLEKYINEIVLEGQDTFIITTKDIL